MSEVGEVIHTQTILEEKIEIKPDNYPKHKIVKITKSLSFGKELLLNGSNDL